METELQCAVLAVFLGELDLRCCIAPQKAAERCALVSASRVLGSRTPDVLCVQMVMAHAAASSGVGSSLACDLLAHATCAHNRNTFCL